jgi:predicted RNase H-like HicB family nuclease
MFLANHPHDLSQVDVYLESNRAGRTIAHVPGLPGCVVRGETPQEAAGLILDAVKQHLDWLGAHRGRALRLPRNAQLRVIGTVAGGAPTGSGSRGALLPTDTIPVGAAERIEHLKRMKSSRADLLEIVSRVPAELLEFRPTPNRPTWRVSSSSHGFRRSQRLLTGCKSCARQRTSSSLHAACGASIAR